jgi:putative hydrolase of the HAD superfamily
MNRHSTVWLFDLDNTLHDASHAAFGPTNLAMTQYIVDHLGFEPDAASRLRQHYWTHYGATLLGLVRHHGVKPAHFLEATHRLPGLEQRLRTSAHDRAALARLPGRKIVLTNAPQAYARRVLDTLGLTGRFEAIVAIDDMVMFGQQRPKPDARMLRWICAKLKLLPQRCWLVEDTLQHQKSARSIGMHTVWMQRYLGGRFRGTRWDAPNQAPNVAPKHVTNGARPRVHPCGRPSYVHARIVSLKALRAL